MPTSPSGLDVRAAFLSEVVTKLYAVVAVPGTAVPLSTTPLYVKKAAITATRAAAVNAGLVFIGDSEVDKDTSRQRSLNPGDEWDLPIAEGELKDLSTVYVDAETATDGVYVMYDL